MPESSLFAPYIQYGFAGFAFLLVGVIVWLIRHLLRILSETNGIIASNTEAINRVHAQGSQQTELLKQVREQLYRRPCLCPPA